MTLNIHTHGSIHIHNHHDSTAFNERLDELITDLEVLAQQSQSNQRRKKRMPLSDAEQALIERFNLATSAVAQRIKDLVANPPANDAEFNTQLTSIADGLDALGKPGEPLPPVV